MKNYDNMRDRIKDSFGNRLKQCSNCSHTSFEIECGYTWHDCEKGHYKQVRTLPIDQECPDFPKSEDNVPGEVLDNAKKLVEKKEVPEPVNV